MALEEAHRFGSPISVAPNVGPRHACLKLAGMAPLRPSGADGGDPGRRAVVVHLQTMAPGRFRDLSTSPAQEETLRRSKVRTVGECIAL